MNSTIKNNDFIYAAGYIDGDGCFYIGKYTETKRNILRYQHRVVISSTNADILKYFAKEFGGSFRKVNDRHIPEGHKPQYQFIISSTKNSSDFIKEVTPFLVEKKQQAEIFYKFLNEECKETKNDLVKLMYESKHNQNIVEEKHVDILKKNKLTVNPQSHDYIYLAGFIDAECCLSIQKYKSKNRNNFHFKIYVTCNNTKFPTIQWIMERFGGQIRFVHRKISNQIHRDQLCWVLSSKSLYEILPFILPHLRYKKPVCEKMIEFYHNTFKNGGDRQSSAFKQNNALILDSRIDIFHKIRSLNKKGI